MNHLVKTCFDCKHAAKYAGHGGTLYEPPEPASAECTHPALTEEYNEDYLEDELPKHCGHFEPTLIEHCPVCKRRMDEPEWIWPLWVMTMYERTPVCSVKCYFELLIEDDRQRNEMLLTAFYGPAWRDGTEVET